MMEGASTTNYKEIVILGKALKALLKAGLISEVEEIVDYMASTDKNDRENDNKDK